MGGKWPSTHITELCLHLLLARGHGNRDEHCSYRSRRCEGAVYCRWFNHLNISSAVVWRHARSGALMPNAVLQWWLDSLKNSCRLSNRQMRYDGTVMFGTNVLCHEQEQHCMSPWSALSHWSKFSHTAISSPVLFFSQWQRRQPIAIPRFSPLVSSMHCDDLLIK